MPPGRCEGGRGGLIPTTTPCLLGQDPGGRDELQQGLSASRGRAMQQRLLASGLRRDAFALPSACERPSPHHPVLQGAGMPGLMQGRGLPSSTGTHFTVHGGLWVQPAELSIPWDTGRDGGTAQHGAAGGARLCRSQK